MSWTRCKECRTIVDAGRHRFCMGCGAPVPPEPGTAGGTAPVVERQARRDTRISLAAWIAWAAFGVIGLVVVAQGTHPVVRIYLTVAVGAVALGAALCLRSRDPSVEAVGRVAIGVLGVAGMILVGLTAAAVGLAILIFILCVAG